jgi:hypothetical protein
MTRLVNVPIVRHDSRDLGWMQPTTRKVSHYFRTVRSSSLAMSHCSMIVLKRDMIDAQDRDYCQYCSMIEDMRNDAESRKQNGGSLDT